MKTDAAWNINPGGKTTSRLKPTCRRGMRPSVLPAQLNNKKRWKTISNQRRTKNDGQFSRTNEGKHESPNQQRTAVSAMHKLHLCKRGPHSNFKRSTRVESYSHEEKMRYPHIPELTVYFTCMNSMSLLTSQCNICSLKTHRGINVVVIYYLPSPRFEGDLSIMSTTICKMWKVWLSI